MVRISENLIRKRAEHNNLEISTLEEVSLHQQDIERIEYIDKWCRDLKILYLQSNLIPKIENVSKLKKLEYLNLALNNVEVIENLEGCESLKKLDLTVNFIGELTSIETLKDLPHFKDLYLTGNPCAQYEGYREYVIGTLKNLERLDGTEIEKSERILALQNYGVVRARIIQQQLAYRKTRAKQKAEAKEREENKGKKKKEKEPGFDGKWYTEINESDKSQEDKENIIEDQGENQDKNEDDEFWKEEVAFTPESRIEVHNHMKKQREKENKKNEEPTQKPRRMFTEDGRPLNVNEAKIDFTLQDDEENNQLILDIACFKHMDTSLINADVQTNYIRVTLKGKVFQLCLDCDVKPDSSSAKRSQTTGHLLITMPKANPLLKPPSKPSKTCETKKKKDEEKRNKGEEKLEVDPKAKKSVDIANIVQEKDLQPKIPLLGTKTRHQTKERPNSDNFIDNDDVPPLI